MILSKKLKTFAKPRRELVFDQGSPLTQKYINLSCENCDNGCEQAVVTSIGLSWRNGWIILCEKCYRSLNIWEETEEEQNRAIKNNSVSICASH